MAKVMLQKHPVLFNVILIVIIAVSGLIIASLSLSLFTKHGQYKTVPIVENMSYTNAINILNDADFKVEISDSVYRADLKPGYVMEQTPKANSKVKPGRVIYLIINAVSPKQVAIANMQGVSLRQAKAVLEGMGFKDIRVSYKLGKHKDIVLGIKVHGKIVRNGQKVAVNAPIIIEVSNGRVEELADSLLNAEYGSSTGYGGYGEGEYGTELSSDPYYSGESNQSEEQNASSSEEIDPYSGHESKSVEQ